MKLLTSIAMSAIIGILMLISWLTIAIIMIVATIITIPIWAISEYKELTKDG